MLLHGDKFIQRGLVCFLGLGKKMEIFLTQIFMYPKNGNREKAIKKKIPKRGKTF